MLDQVKKEQDTELDKLSKKYNVRIPDELSPSKDSKEVKESKEESKVLLEAEKKEEVSVKEERKEKSSDLEEDRIRRLEKEKDEKIKMVLAKFGNQISQLETQLKQNKSKLF